MKKKAPTPQKLTPVWESGKKTQDREERRFLKTTDRPWRMHYDLAYDGGGSEFDQYYRTKFGAKFSAFFHLYFRSWGGSAELYENPPKNPLIKRVKKY